MTTPTNTPSPLDPAKNLANSVLQNANNAVAPTLAYIDQLQQQRAVRLAAAEVRLKASLGADHPRVIALTQSAQAVSSFQQTLHVEAIRAARQPMVGPTDWLVSGCVLDLRGQAVAGVHVRVFDRDRKYDALLGDTTTDELGDFTVRYHERDFAELREANPELYVMISDSAGTLLYSSKDRIRFEAGRVEYFQIALNTPPQTVVPKRVKPRAARKPAVKPTGVKRTTKAAGDKQTPKSKGSGSTGSDNVKG